MSTDYEAPPTDLSIGKVASTVLKSGFPKRYRKRSEAEKITYQRAGILPICINPTNNKEMFSPTRAADDTSTGDASEIDDQMKCEYKINVPLLAGVTKKSEVEERDDVCLRYFEFGGRKRNCSEFPSKCACR